MGSCQDQQKNAYNKKTLTKSLLFIIIIYTSRVYDLLLLTKFHILNNWFCDGENYLAIPSGEWIGTYKTTQTFCPIFERDNREYPGR